jgi:protein-disulfide isomerase
MVLFTVGALALGAIIVAIALLQQKSAPASSNELTSPVARVPAGLSEGRSLGTADAPVTIEIWSDFQCPACRALAVDVEPSIIAAYVVPGDVKLVYHDAAFQGQRGDPRYDESVQAAAAARAAADQGRFWQMHDWLFANWNGENKGAFSAERLTAIAGAAGLDGSAYAAAMAVGDKQAAVKDETQQGVAVGVNSTPTLFINGTRFTGAPTLDQLSALIESARQ